MNAAEAEEYTRALGQVVAGSWRLIASGQRLGVPKALGLTTEAWVKERLGGYVKLSLSERTTAAVELKAEGLSNRKIAAVLGVSYQTVNDDLKPDKFLSPGASDRPDVPGLDDKNLSPSEPLDVLTGLAATDAMRIAMDKQTAKEAAIARTRARRDASRSATARPDGYDLRIGDARDVLADVPDNSVHLVLTDPPYGDAAEPLYTWLAEWSARVLVPGGSLICFTGHATLVRDLNLLSVHLRYWWQLVMRHNQARRLPGKFVMAEYKPVLWFVKGHRRGRTLVNDVLRPDRRDKVGHDWGQGDGGVQLLIEQLTDPDEQIADPFAGTAQWGAIATRMGRRWLGADLVEGGAAICATA